MTTRTLLVYHCLVVEQESFSSEKQFLAYAKQE